MVSQAKPFNLTQMTALSRASLKFIVGGVVLFLVSRFALNAFTSYWLATHPPPPPPPTVGFGLLPSPSFPTRPDLVRPSQYLLELPTGKLPEFPDRATIFFMPKNAPSLLDHEQALGVANQLGFVFEPKRVDSRTYRWQKSEPLLSTLTLDIQDHVFSYTTDFLNRPELFIGKSIPSKYDSVQLVKNYLSKAVSVGDDLATASGEFVLVKAVGSELMPAVSVADANFVVVDLQRAAVFDQFPVVTERGDRGIVHAVVGPSSAAGSILTLENNYFPVDYSLGHTYPLRPIRQAWDLVQSGEAYLAQSTSADKAVIRQVELGYLDLTSGQDYLQPVYIFRGDGDFMALVPAVEAAYLIPARI